MAKPNLLYLVESIMSDMDSDPVNSITDTVESYQVAKIVESVYNQVVSNRNWPTHKTLLSLSSSGDSTKPTHVSIPEEVKEIMTVFYNVEDNDDTDKKYREIHYIYPDEFLRKTNNRKSSSSDTDVITDVSGVEILIKNDVAPTYWTSFDDDYIIFDSYDSAVDSTIQESKLQVWGVSIPAFTLSDTFVIDLPQEAFAMLESKAKANAFAKIKQARSQLDEEEYILQQRYLSRKASRAKSGVRTRDFGRRSTKGVRHRSKLFDKG